MTHYSVDVLYAYAQIGIAPGAALGKVREVLADAAAYRFATRARTEHVRRFAEFFMARETFGTVELSFTEIRKAYLKQAKAHHPDSNEGDREAEDVLKAVNTAFEIVEKIHREAKEYFRKDEKERQK